MEVHTVEIVVAAAIEVAGTSLVVSGDATGVEPPILGTVMVGLFTVVGASPLIGVSTINTCGIDVGEVVASFGSIGALGTTITGVVSVGTMGDMIVGTLGWSTDTGAAAGDVIVSHWNAVQDLLSTAIQLNHGSTTSRHRRQDKQSILTALQTIPSYSSHSAPELIVSLKHCRQSEPMHALAKARSSTHASGVKEKSFSGSQ